MSPHHDDQVDVVLVLEGTYPFVLGGVSTWVHQLVRKLPELDFGILHIAPRLHHYGKPAYQLPRNVVFVEEVGLLSGIDDDGPGRRRRRWRAAIAEFWQLLEQLRSRQPVTLTQLAGQIEQLTAAGIGPDDVLANQACWDAMLGCYEAEAVDQSFLDFFWTWRFAHQPLVELLFRRVPRAAMYHTVSTGYAGMVAAVAAARWQQPMILTEHGIYTKERRIEIYSANWIHHVEDDDVVVDDKPPYFRQFWNRHFEVMGGCCYAQADHIFTLFGQNRLAQVADGADPAKIAIIPNGVNVAALTAALRAAPPRDPRQPFTVAFIGRVAPIKDLRTFLAAMRLVAREVPDVVVRVLGPTQEDPDYADKCVQFAHELGLGAHVRFEGTKDIRKELPTIDVVLLTSISEAQPLIVLEAGAFGVPVVATDVGSCRELLLGRSAADQAIGAGGFLVPIASPGAVAQRVLELHADPELRRRLGRNLQERVRRFYDERSMIAAYRTVYRSCLQMGLVER